MGLAAGLVRVRVRELPLHVRFLAGESTGSYATRLAGRNGLEVQQLLDEVGQGRTRVVAPHLTELYLNRPAAERLAALAGHPLEVMRRALASLDSAYLLDDGDGTPAWSFPWSVTDGYLVRACALCTARRGISEPAWMMLADPWHLCARHSRWSDNSRDPQIPWIDVADWPRILVAGRQLRVMERRLGRTARALFADARTMSGLDSSAPGRIQEMADRLGEARAASLLSYAPTIRIARVLARAERRRLSLELTRNGYRDWLAGSSRELGPRYRQLLEQWKGHHALLLDRNLKRQGGLGRTVLVAPHERIAPLDSVEQLTCMLTRPVTSPFDRPFL